jgi:2-polyprenyl-6-hydroxyphenyl methylase/3-demethylubiquinone-9 3-methyltransferase
MDLFSAEVKEGRRFEFGKNWQGFLTTLTDERIGLAEASIREMLETDSLRGRTFLDIGSGSGLFSLAARRMGARVHAFDLDPLCVACTQELRSRYFPCDTDWIVEQGSIIDHRFLESLGSYDIVYAWGVLHHTGNMWHALDKAASLVKQHGALLIAIYNDQGGKSKFWKQVKKLYCSGWAGKAVISCLFLPLFFSITLLRGVLRNENIFSRYQQKRGMSITHDWLDWLGGLPFEVATVDQIFRFLTDREFVLTNLKTTRGLGNNQFVFTKSAPPSPCGRPEAAAQESFDAS